ncbi:baseplate J/gp47 family protein [Methylobacterium sp. CCH5-D2]|uniref:baseplate J/gp47 family protein n=1 Tax=Methylobacterium sp. CCH5-D2 TaxID=1768765 RepID=UPI00082EB049|nr:baseplate J/gp47 family protein [Methylobacterium sp. CCH5-D2]
MASPPVCTIDETGIHRPPFEDCLAYYADGYRGIYGQDIVLDEDTQDGQWIRLQADALHQANGAMVAVYNAFSPATAQGVGLSRSVKLNGLRRKIATASTADVRIIGQAGTQIEDGQIADADGTVWTLPALVEIPFSGETTATATCSEPGAVAADPGALSVIETPVPGWQSVSNPRAAVPGAPIERDPALRRRQAASTMAGAATVVGGMIAEIGNLPGVIHARGYINPTLAVDQNGLPPRSYALVIEGGDAGAIASVIGRKAPPGVPPIGNTRASYIDPFGIAQTITFTRPTIVPATYQVRLRAKRGFTDDVKADIRAALATFTESVGIGGQLERGGAYVPARLGNGPGSETYSLVGVDVARDGAEPGETDLAFRFDERPEMPPDGVAFVSVP